MPQPLRVFFSYAHEDDRFRIRLEKSLKLLERQGLVESLHDRKLLPGDDWSREIDAQLERAELIVFLVSPDFIDSDYCWGVEMKRALAREAAGEVRVVPLVVRPIGDWGAAPFSHAQALLGAKAVTSYPDEDVAWAEVAVELRRLVERFQPGGAAVATPAGSAPDPTRYLEALDLEHSYVEIRGMGAQVAEQMPLERVYTRLRVGPGAGGGVEELGRERGKGRLRGDLPEMGERSLDLADVLREHRHAVLIGDPGSGKTTFLRFAAQVLARGGLGRPELVREELGIEGEPPFPVFVRLSQFAEFLADPAHGDASCPVDAPEHFRRYLDFSLRGRDFGLAEGYLRRRVGEGGCFLLLDGLDEVPGALRARVAQIVAKLVIEGVRTNRYLLTCRTRAWEGTTRLTSLPSFRLAPFEPEQIAAFVAAWSRALFRVPPEETESERLAQAEAYRKKLLGDVEAHPNVRPLTESPLMLTMLAVVHWNRKRLPEQRVELYEAAVEYLIESRKDQSEVPATLRREALQALALRMFEDEEGVQRSLGRRVAAEAVAGILGVGADAAETFLDGESLHSGLLVSRSDGEFEFWHLTFQEYLAAVELASDEAESWPVLEPHFFDDRWSEVVLLYTGWLRWRRGPKPVQRLIGKVLARGGGLPELARAVGLLGRVLRDVRPFGGDPAAGTGYEAALEKVLAIFSPTGPRVEEKIRVEVGEALGQACDPRLDGENRVELPGGRFLRGAQKDDPKGLGYDPEAYGDEEPVRWVTVSPFAIGRYPVTVGEFRRFVEEGDRGYLNPRLWAPEGWAWRDEQGFKAPGTWEAQVRHPNRPVVEVSWFEADAYCRWVGGRLPTEAEWEYAARGSESRKYPWGAAEPGPERANFAMRVGAPTPVGIYPHGATPEGVHDLAGNAWEWCADWFANRYPAEDLTDPAGPAAGESRVLRGGAFNRAPGLLRGAARSGDRPENRGGGNGFRVVWRRSAAGLD